MTVYKNDLWLCLLLCFVIDNFCKIQKKNNKLEYIGYLDPKISDVISQRIFLASPGMWFIGQFVDIQ